ncbi:hypothetical protein P152DRAFT_404285 [Eremomyces bilateralis CBS 781.70]|uniref:ditrans,polycis-polyprenyl diphosphate synthase [(2E,6E)-farnesyldiphosphate specific] n=1 Tax=Eremomyces bilateralis CBS 781.70 TaxID=1392243 RepID=A0A6G1FT70_9PEZI|nr:uncharacterized protein P152DRAFT_404285 [Eremomyces bilateralis CBS 781.70]KAF1808930.1 hypothetical protein P152DRAFT_404285 [Eremomyces bilateralis CBS 781.70]
MSQRNGSKPKPPRRKPVRKFIRERIYLCLFLIVHAVFAVYMRVRRVVRALKDRMFALTYYHHHTPELIRRDVAKLSKIPRHLSVVVSYDPRGNGGVELERLLNHVGELSAWCASAGIETLSVYERTGILKTHIPTTHAHITSTLHTYFPPHTTPALSLRCPNHPSFSPPSTPPSPFSQTPNPRLTVILLSAEDGRDTIVDLTKTLTEMSQRGKLAPSDISTDLVDAEITESVMGEPDLVVCFGERMKLDGFPPWQIRLSEIFCSPDNSSGVGYQVFLRALHKFGKAQMRFGT